ncbi:hypothetical protein W911_06925 [Hyphomicrobium nitrativorans NL23]|uniref:Uncharacterized protein n=1 Tax=Hyphomicrobium nitrativorans NL23 TaxID=1029756 RepID=V5SHU7_9HYPH|nr:hypothetical protein W911_06925 [Hyphomicrobium nitrativorans NL23]
MAFEGARDLVNYSRVEGIAFNVQQARQAINTRWVTVPLRPRQEAAKAARRNERDPISWAKSSIDLHLSNEAESGVQVAVEGALGAVLCMISLGSRAQGAQGICIKRLRIRHGHRTSST